MDLSRGWWAAVLGGLVILAVGLLLAAGDQDGTFAFEDRGTLGVIPVRGPISYGDGLSAQGTTPSQIASLTAKAEDAGVDAIMYEINSPGGGVVASREAARTVADAEVPAVCRLQEVAASGAYWMAAACDRIVADELTMTGSIGVTTTYLEMSELLDRFGVEYVNLTAGRFKDMGSQFKNLTPEERQRFEEILDQVHRTFIEDIARYRNMSVAAVEAEATGEIFLGRTAATTGLVDRVGGEPIARQTARNLTNRSSLRTRTFAPPQQFDPLSLLFTQIGEGIVSGVQQATAVRGMQARARTS